MLEGLIRTDLVGVWTCAEVHVHLFLLDGIEQNTYLIPAERLGD